MDAINRQFRQLARYNTRANASVYDACATLSDAERRRDRGGFFGSIHGTLNHIMVGDRIWFARFEGAAVPPLTLDTILFEDFVELRAAREAEDVRIEGFVAGLTGADIDGHLVYKNLAGQETTDPMSLLLPHVFNHQTHHRGQVHDMLSQAGVETPVSDMHRVLRPGATGQVDMV